MSSNITKQEPVSRLDALKNEQLKTEDFSDFEVREKENLVVVKENLAFDRLIMSPYEYGHNRAITKFEQKFCEQDFVRGENRQSSISFLYDCLSQSYELDIAIFHARMLEAQIFSESSQNCIEYENTLRKCGNTLMMLGKNRKMVDNLMVRCLDLNTLKLAGSLPIDQIKFATQDREIQTNIENDHECHENLQREIFIVKLTKPSPIVKVSGSQTGALISEISK